MKFGRYLVENQTPEWKRAYIDYRACKKAIKVVGARIRQNGDVASGEEEKDSSDQDEDHGPSAAPRSLRGSTKSGSNSATPKLGKDEPKSRQRSPGYGATGTSPRPITRIESSNPPPLDIGESSLPERSTPGFLGGGTLQSPEGESSGAEGSRHRSSDEGLISGDSTQPLNTGLKARFSPRLSKSHRFAEREEVIESPRINRSASELGSGSGRSPQVGRRSLRSFTAPSPRIPVRSARTFTDLYPTLHSDEQAFFDLLAHELDKVQSFYSARESDALKRSSEIKDQLKELAEHRKVFHELYPEGIPEWEVKVGKILPGAASGVVNSGLAELGQKLHLRVPFSSEGDHGTNGASSGNGKSRAPSPVMDDGRKKNLREAMASDRDHQTYNPERYQKYKRELKTAVLEFYRQLELVKNYRIMNLTGFRKALKKFEKTSKVHCLEMYSDEQIMSETFAEGKEIDKLIKQTEELYTEHFEHGDSKRAREKLRRQFREKTHYGSAFRSGILIGLGVPATIFGLVKAMQNDTPTYIPAWNGLLQVYGAFYLPIIFALLFQLNLDAWVQARINYEFVMELSKPNIDYRSFAELPAFLLATLSYCLVFSYYRVGASHVAPTTWPLAWLVFLAAFWLNPIDIFRRSSRYWLLRVLFRVCTPGYSRVEFIAFFIADELNSLIYTIQGIYFMGCAYDNDWPSDIYTKCRSGASWPYAILLCLPALSRLIQCLKRYHDSQLKIHLINAGKYLSTIAQLCMFVLWRSRGSKFHDASFIVWVIVATITSTYTSTWDLVIDWSLFRPDSGFLRHELGYSNRYVYYIAMVTNILIRFVWVWYIPASASHTRVRSFFFALAEMLRRWQWNFFRVETEHLGNADAYRVTREIPLPYRKADHDSDDEDESATRLRRKRSQSNALTIKLEKIRRDLVGETMGKKGSTTDESRSNVRQRQYEARRPVAEDGNREGEV